MKNGRSGALALAIAAFAGAAQAGILVTNNFDADPNWDALNNRTSPQNFGFSNSSFAGGSAGEIGGVVDRDPTLAYYAHNFGPGLGLNESLLATGSLRRVNSTGQYGLLLGWFNASTATFPPSNFLGLEFADSSGGGVFIGMSDSNGPLVEQYTGFSITTDAVAFPFSLSYDPNLGANGRITATISTTTSTYDLTAAQRADGATFDHFGIYNVTVDAQSVEMYFDNLIYTIPEPNVIALWGFGGIMLLWRWRRKE